jgi:hypothetical protein
MAFSYKNAMRVTYILRSTAIVTGTGKTQIPYFYSKE